MNAGGARRLALITGASAGLGAEFARLYAEKGWDLALTARRADRLEALARELEAACGVSVLVIPLDMAGRDAPARLVADIEARGRHVDALVNNAGYSITNNFLGVAPEDHAAMLAVMVEAPVMLARLLAPGMVGRGYGRIINVASLAGLLPATGGDTLYGPLKSFLIKASSGLHLELMKTGVHVTALCPGYTLTEFHDANGSRRAVERAYADWMWMAARPVVEAGYEAVEANRPVVIPGRINRLVAALSGVVPRGMALRMALNHSRRLKRLSRP